VKVEVLGMGGGLTEVGKADEEVGDEEDGRAVEAVGAVFEEDAAVLEEGGDVGDDHEGEKGGAEELLMP
jgi:hypothetical protein